MRGDVDAVVLCYLERWIENKRTLCFEKWHGRHFEIFGGLVVPFSRKVGHDTVKECFRCVCVDPNRDTGALDEVWGSACCPNVLILRLPEIKNRPDRDPREP